MVMLAGTATWIAYSVLAPAAGLSWQRTTVSGFVVLSVSGLIGKLMGLIMARIRFHFMVRSLGAGHAGAARCKRLDKALGPVYIHRTTATTLIIAAKSCWSACQSKVGFGSN